MKKQEQRILDLERLVYALMDKLGYEADYIPEKIKIIKLKK